MNYTVKLIQDVEIRPGDKFRSTLKDHTHVVVKLVAVPMENGDYTMTACRWILVSEDRGSPTWDNKFHATPQDALGVGKWEKV